jgi:hypothetical protein
MGSSVRDEWHTARIGPQQPGSYTPGMTILILCPRPWGRDQARRILRHTVVDRPVSAPLAARLSSANPDSTNARILDIPVWGGFCAIQRSVQRDIPRSAVPWDLAPTKADSCVCLAVVGTRETMSRSWDVLQHSRTPLTNSNPRIQIGNSDWLAGADRNKRNDQRPSSRLWFASTATTTCWRETRDSRRPTGQDSDSVSRVARHSG